jgi:hypothetical protein
VEQGVFTSRSSLEMPETPRRPEFFVTRSDRSSMERFSFLGDVKKRRRIT